ncbi:hypothetical protein [Pseudomonas putida]|uniref:Uncharacterized protein n=1 Tax=Pseudomonas putida TaxID=303 RepID=A0A6S5TQM8_PSEPU|nr:hypothetical protein [Pseudomonas putida]BBT40423.1 hypothetical protein WP8W18C01_27640 [Pseudomonas putida]
MVGITGINIASPSLATTTQAGEADKTEQGKATGVQVDLSGLRDTTQAKQAKQAKQAESAEDSGEPPHIKQLREMIKKLQKQLAEEQKQLAQLAAQNMDETSKLAAITAKQASIATISGEIQAATAQLLEALSKTGGSSAGGMVSTQA